MQTKSLLILLLLSATLYAKNIDLDKFYGSWYLRMIDGNNVGKIKANLDFNSKQMKLYGFDGCNRIAGDLVKNMKQQLSAHIISTRMACLDSLHQYVSKKLQETLNEGFSIKEEKKHGIEGITLKSEKHELFFKRIKKD